MSIEGAGQIEDAAAQAGALVMQAVDVLLESVCCSREEAREVLQDIACGHGMTLEAYSAVVVDRALRSRAVHHDNSAPRPGSPD